MKFEVVDFDGEFGKHRYSNNKIINSLIKNSELDRNFKFVWWIERIFLVPELNKRAEELISTDWFGVAHVPLLTPNWAMYGQNDLSKLYYSPIWREAKKRCKGIICLSEHMRGQFQALHPDLQCFSISHPMSADDNIFQYKKWLSSKKIIIAGAWLRNFQDFAFMNTNLKKVVLYNHYAKNYLTHLYSRYAPNILDDLKPLESLNFIDDSLYDSLLTESVVYIDVHETSANNLLCECLLYSVPFVAKRHPALEEYCGIDYPLFVNNLSNLYITDDVVQLAHNYLFERRDIYKKKLSLEKFVQDFKNIYNKIYPKLKFVE